MRMRPRQLLAQVGSVITLMGFVVTTTIGAASAAVTTNPEIFVDENQTAISTLSSDLPNPSWSIVGGEDAAKFSIDPATGALEFNTAPDFENPDDVDTNKVYLVRVKDDPQSAASYQFRITLENVVEVTKPSFSSPDSVSVAENTTAVVTVDASATAGTVVLTIGGRDASLFEFAPGTNDLRFKSAPDFETPNSGATPKDNVYEVEITATSSGGGEADQTETQTITITVTDEAAPSGLIITPAPGGLQVEVTAPSTANILYYTVEVRIGSQWHSVLSLTGTATVGGLAGNTTYDVRVAAISVDGVGLYVSGSATTSALPAGADGRNGADGVAGRDGIEGARGPQGSAGPTGPAGATGPQGPAGATGPAGRDGVLVGFDGNVTLLSRAQRANISKYAATSRASVRVSIYRGRGESLARMQQRARSIKAAITAANPNLRFSAKYFKTAKPAACRSVANRCAVVVFSSR